MKYLVISDIHANQVALEAVLEHARKQKWDEIMFLGDLVGYYTEPNACADILRDLKPKICILGNHDALLLRMATGQTIESRERSVVLDIIRRHLKELTQDNLEFIHSFIDRTEDVTWQATHGALETQWTYMNSLEVAEKNLPYLEKNVCFVGHTHVPIAFAHLSTPKGDMWRTVSFRQGHSTYRFPPTAKVFFNPGSVGQPRDGIPQASYAIFDELRHKVELFRVSFNIAEVQHQVKSLVYPEVLGQRLESGR